MTPFLHHLGDGGSPVPYTVPDGKYLTASVHIFGSGALTLNGTQAHSSGSVIADTNPRPFVLPAGTVISLSAGSTRAHLSGFLHNNPAGFTAFLRNMGTGSVPDPYSVPADKFLVATAFFHGTCTINIGGNQSVGANDPTPRPFVFPPATAITLSGSNGRCHLSGFLYPNPA